MKKILCFIMLVFGLISILAGCYPDNYKLVQEDGVYYVDMNLRPHGTTNTTGGYFARGMYFSTLDELVNDFQTGNFTEDEFEALKTFDRSEDGKIPVPNLANLLEPIVPDSLGQPEILVCEDRCSFYYQPEDAAKVSVSFNNQAVFHKKVEAFLNYEESLAEVDQLLVSQEPERNATVYTWTTKTGETAKYILYTIDANDTVYYVHEWYENAEGEQISLIEMWFEQQEKYMFVKIKSPEVRPSIEWLTSFSLKPYEGTLSHTNATLWVCVGSAVVVLAGGVTAVLIIRKKRKQQMAQMENSEDEIT